MKRPTVIAVVGVLAAFGAAVLPAGARETQSALPLIVPPPLSQITPQPASPPASPPPPGPSPCSPGFPWEYAGYTHGLPAVNNPISVNIQNVRDVLLSGGGAVASWFGVTQYDSGGNALNWIQAGIFQAPGGQNELYIETMLNGDHEFPYTFVGASYGTNYHVTLTRTATSTWQETIGSSPPVTLSFTATSNSSTLTSENQNATATCQASDFQFSSSTWGTSGMTPFADTPYRVTNITSNGWESTGPTGFIWPQ